MPRPVDKLKFKDPGSVKKMTTNGKKVKTTALKRDPFNNSVTYDQNLKNAGLNSAASHRRPIVGSTYRITDGRYKGELCKVHSVHSNDAFMKVEFLTTFMKPTGKYDLVPVKYIDVNGLKKEY